MKENKIKKKVTLLPFLIFLFILLLALVTPQFLQEYYIVGDDHSTDFKKNQYVAQTFTVGSVGENKDMNIDMIGLKLDQSSIGSEKINISIRNVVGGKPSGDDLIGNYSLTCDDIPNNAAGEWFNITFGSSLAISSGGQYAIVVTTGSDDDLAYWRDDGSSPTYAGGEYLICSSSQPCTDPSDWSSSPTKDFMFMVYEEEIPLSTGLTITLNKPSNSASLNGKKVNFNATLTPNIADDLNLTNATFYVWNGTYSLFNITTNSTISGVSANDSFLTMPNFAIGDYIWNVWGCGVNRTDITNTSCMFSPTNYTFTIGATINDNWHKNWSFDTDSGLFITNISLIDGSELYSASLNYNGTFYSATKSTIGTNKYQLRRTIDFPIINITKEKNFYWTFTFDNGLGVFSQQNTTSTNLNLFPSALNQTTNEGVGINYTVFDEVTLEDITADFKGTFDWYLGTGTVTKNSSYNLTDHEFNFYIYPRNQSHYTDVKLEISYSPDINKNQTYSNRIFEFNKANISTNMTYQKLYLINSSLTTNIQIEVVDQGYNPLEDYYVTIKRFYPSENKYRMIENRKTDGSGQFSAKLVQRNVIYSMEFRDSSNNLVHTEDDLTFACTSSYCTRQFTLPEQTNELDRFSNQSGYVTTLNFNEDSRTFLFTWEDSDKLVEKQRLTIKSFSFNSSSIVFNQSSTSNLGSLTHTVGTHPSSYTAMVYISINGEEKIYRQISARVGGASDIFGVEGLIWSLILLFTLIAIGAFNPIVGILLYIVGVLFLGFSNIVYINPAIIVAEIVIGVLFIWAFRA